MNFAELERAVLELLEQAPDGMTVNDLTGIIFYDLDPAQERQARTAVAHACRELRKKSLSYRDAATGVNYLGRMSEHM